MNYTDFKFSLSVATATTFSKYLARDFTFFSVKTFDPASYLTCALFLRDVGFTEMSLWNGRTLEDAVLMHRIRLDFLFLSATAAEWQCH